MILSHDWRFLFLKTRKTASTSVEIALSSICGPLDVITPIVPEDEAVRFESTGRTAQNHLLGHRPPPAPGTRPADHFQQPSPPYRLHTKLVHHLRATQVRSVVGERIWNGYFRFTIERDPFGRLESHYFWGTQRAKVPVSFSQWLRSDLPRNTRNRDIYFDGDQLSVDFIIDFAHLESDLQLLTQTLGWSPLAPLPRTKHHTRRGRTIPWTAADRSFVEQHFVEELETYEAVRRGTFREALRARAGR